MLPWRGQNQNVGEDSVPQLDDDDDHHHCVKGGVSGRGAKEEDRGTDEQTQGGEYSIETTLGPEEGFNHQVHVWLYFVLRHDIARGGSMLVQRARCFWCGCLEKTPSVMDLPRKSKKPPSLQNP